MTETRSIFNKCVDLKMAHLGTLTAQKQFIKFMKT